MGLRTFCSTLRKGIMLHCEAFPGRNGSVTELKGETKSTDRRSI